VQTPLLKYPVQVPLLKYSVMRLALFVASMGLLYLLQIRGLLNIVLAAVISLLLSYLLLRRPREELTQQIADRVAGRLKGGPSARRSSLGLDDDAEAEDAALDSAEGDESTAADGVTNPPSAQ
jgi:hypothetical protein